MPRVAPPNAANDLFSQARELYLVDQETLRIERTINEALNSSKDWTVGQHLAWLLKPRSSEEKSHYVTQKGIILSEAFKGLSPKAAKMYLVASALTWWTPSKPNKKKGYKPDDLELPYKRAMAAGIAASNSTIRRCFKELEAARLMIKIDGKIGIPNVYHLVSKHRIDHFPILEKGSILCPAFFELSGPAAKLLALCHATARWEKGGQGKRPGRRKQPRVAHDFEFPYSKAREMGVSKDNLTIQKAFCELEALGFVQTVQERPGTPTVFRISNAHKQLTLAKAKTLKEALWKL